MSARLLWRAFRTRYRDCRAECAALKAHLTPVDTVCDIGANKGAFTFWLSRWTPRGKVVAFEPQPPLAGYLRSVCDTLALDNVTVEPKAVSSRTATAVLYAPGGSASPGASLNRAIADLEECTACEVATVSLDDYFAEGEKVGALKIDVEGAELDVFKGARRILTESKPLLIFECENRHLGEGTVFDVFEYLREFGYRGQCVRKNKPMDISEFSPDKHQQQTGERYWNRKDYVNNFIFRPSPDP